MPRVCECSTCSPTPPTTCPWWMRSFCPPTSPSAPSSSPCRRLAFPRCRCVPVRAWHVCGCSFVHAVPRVYGHGHSPRHHWLRRCVIPRRGCVGGSGGRPTDARACGRGPVRVLHGDAQLGRQRHGEAASHRRYAARTTSLQPVQAVVVLVVAHQLACGWCNVQVRRRSSATWGHTRP